MKVLCKLCNREVVGLPNKSKSCGCSNMTTVYNDRVTAVDLGKVLLLESERNLKKGPLLSNADLKYQEDRRKRKVRKLNFEER